MPSSTSRSMTTAPMPPLPTNIMDDLCSAVQALCSAVANSATVLPGVDDIQEIATDELTVDQVMDLAHAWAAVEDDPLVRDVEVDELIEQLQEQQLDGELEEREEADEPMEENAATLSPAISERDVDSAMLLLLNYCSSRKNTDLIHVARRLDHMIRSDRATARSLLQPSIHMFFPSTSD